VTDKDRPSPLAEQLRALRGGTVLDMGKTRFDLVSGAGDGPQVGPQQLRQFYKGQFETADKGKNGYLDKRESDAVPLSPHLTCSSKKRRSRVASPYSAAESSSHRSRSSELPRSKRLQPSISA